MDLLVKNRFSDLTKVQIGWDQHRIDVMKDGWEKALKEGCHEREQAWTDMSSREKPNTKEVLARVMAKSNSTSQTVTNGCVGQKGKDLCCWEAFQCQRSCGVSKIEA